MQKHTIEELIEDVEYEQLCYKDEIIEILEKQVAKKPTNQKPLLHSKKNSLIIEVRNGFCPNCRQTIDSIHNMFFHDDADCGQKLDWSDT
jgi:hypothetical protein